MSDSKKKSKRRHTPSSGLKSLDALTSRDVIENGLSHFECNVPPRDDTASESSQTDIGGTMHPLEDEDYLKKRQEVDTLAKRSPLIAKKSPAKSAASRCSTMLPQNQDIYNLTLDKLGLASHMVPLPVYKFLDNISMDSTERIELKLELFTLLRTDQYGYPYITDVKLSSTHGKINDTVQKVPRLLPSLRQWIRLVSMAFSSSLQNLFLCVTKPDPLSDPNFIHLYQTMDKSQTDIAAWLTHKIAEWNQSESLLREVLTTAIEKALSSDDEDNMKTYKLVQSIWLRSFNEKMNFNGNIMFWALKDVLHAKPELSARAILDKINTIKMKSNIKWFSRL